MDPPLDGETPMRFYLRGYFTKLLQKKREKPVGTKSKQKVKPRFYGEALTLDEVAERFAAEEAQKSEQKKSKKKRAGCTKVARRKSLSGTQGVKATVKKSRGQNAEDSAKSSNDDEDAVEEKCQKCGKWYEDDDEEVKETWIGCDNCWRWYHYTCVDLLVKPSEDEYWCCHQCKK